MRRLRPFLLIGVALIGAAAASVMVFRWLNARSLQSQDVVSSQESAPAELTEIAVADYDIPWGQTLVEDMIAMIPFPLRISSRRPLYGNRGGSGSDSTDIHVSSRAHS